MVRGSQYSVRRRGNGYRRPVPRRTSYAASAGALVRGARALQRSRQSPYSVASWARRVAEQDSLRKRVTFKARTKRRGAGRFLAKGIYAGKFKKASKFKRSLFRGVKVRTEIVGEVVAGAADECVWLGGTANAPATWGRHLLCGLLRYLSYKLGRQFNSEHELIELSLSAFTGNTGRFRWQYTRASEPDVVERSFVIGNGVTWGTLADAWYTDIGSAFAGDTANMVMCNFWIDFQTRDAVTNLNVNGFSYVDCRELLVDFQLSSSFKIQNRTTGDTNTDDSTTNVEANPIVGKHYVIKGNEFNLNFGNDAAVTQSWRIDASSGFLTIDPNEASLTDGMKNVLKRPPNGQAINRCKKTALVRLQPGHIKQTFVTDKGTMYVNTLMNILFNTVATTVGPVQQQKFAQLQMFCMQKTMRTGTGSSNVTVGYEHVMYHMFAVRPKPRKPYVMEQN